MSVSDGMVTASSTSLGLCAKRHISLEIQHLCRAIEKRRAGAIQS